MKRSYHLKHISEQQEKSIKNNVETAQQALMNIDLNGMFRQNQEYAQTIREMEDDYEGMLLKHFLLSVELSRKNLDYVNQAAEIKRLRNSVDSFKDERILLIEATKKETEKRVSDHLRAELEAIQQNGREEMQRLEDKLSRMSQELDSKDDQLEKNKVRIRKLEGEAMEATNEIQGLKRELNEQDRHWRAKLDTQEREFESRIAKMKSEF